MADYTARIITGLATLIDTAGIGVYREAGAYDPGEIGIVFGALPQSPQAAICLTPYQESDAVRTTLHETYVQVRTRTSRSMIESLSVYDAVRDLLHRRSYLVLDGVRISSCRRISTAYLGVHQLTGFHDHTQNFCLTGSRPHTNE